MFTYLKKHGNIFELFLFPVLPADNRRSILNTPKNNRSVFILVNLLIGF